MDGTSTCPVVWEGSTPANVGCVAALGAAAQTFTNGITAPTFTSNVSTGTAPFTVTSTTNVPNLNASSLSGRTLAAPTQWGFAYGSSATGYATTAALTANALVKAGSSAAPSASSITDTGTFVKTTELIKTGNTVLLAADSSGITATTAATATTVFTLPGLQASTNYSVHCSGTTTQATAGGGIGLAIQTATTAATNMELHATVATSATAISAQSSGSLSTTTESAIYTGTTGTVTTQLPWEVDGSIEVGATAPASIVIGFFSASASDAVVVKRDSYCTVLP